jgi:hypothetical protein
MELYFVGGGTGCHIADLNFNELGFCWHLIGLQTVIVVGKQF